MRKLLREPRQPSDPVPSAVRAALEQIPADLVRELSAQPERVVSMGAMTLSTKSTSLNVELAEDGSGRIGHFAISLDSHAFGPIPLKHGSWFVARVLKPEWKV